MVKDVYRQVSYSNSVIVGLVFLVLTQLALVQGDTSAKENECPDITEDSKPTDNSRGELDVLAGKYQYTRCERADAAKYEFTFRRKRPNEGPLARYSIRKKFNAGEDSLLSRYGKFWFFTIKNSSEMFASSTFQNGSK